MRRIFGWRSTLISKIVAHGIMHSQKVTVWCRFWTGGVIIDLFETDIEYYSSMVNNLFSSRLNDMNVDNMWFQQNDATYHAANAWWKFCMNDFRVWLSLAIPVGLFDVVNLSIISNRLLPSDIYLGWESIQYCLSLFETWLLMT